MTASKWHPSTYIAISTADNLKLTRSAMDVQEVFKDSMLTLQNHLIFIDAYPDSNPQEKFSFLKKILLNEAEVEAPKVFDRLKQDPEYLKVFTESLETRVSLFRNKFKTAAAARTLGHYSLEGEKSFEYVNELLNRKRYIYPGNIKKGKFETNKLYEHAIFTDVLSDILLSGRKHSLLSRHQDAFTVTWQGDTNQEIPKSLLALVATAIHASLCDAKFKGTKPAKFTAEEFSSVYTTHIGVLTRLEETCPRAYHHLLEQLFSKAVNTATHTYGDPDVDNIFNDLDLDGIEEN
ncbi:hypothetical protein BDW22DRAFT_1433717 [Trametopsis cervina]|nr:hypothetical protein BDW22DRAFT_1433717 [Trametopsis cervina]